MNCPKCKTERKLQTKRTTGNSTTVIRERYCGKCKGIYKTIEMFVADRKGELGRFTDQLYALEDKKETAEEQYFNLVEAVKTIHSVCHIKG